MKKVAVIGANGQLGSEIVKVFSQRKRWRITPLFHRQIEVKNSRKIAKVFAALKPDIVVNTAAFHETVVCEQEPEEALAVNGLGVKNLAEWSAKNKAVLVHFSTDYVFGGDLTRKRPYSENDPVNPQSAYAISKVAGEFFLRTIAKKEFLIRVSGLYSVAGSSVKGSNLVDNVVKKAKRGETIYMVEDQVLSPTYAKNVAENLELLLRTRKFGLYHMVSQGECSWYQFARAILTFTGLDTKLVPVKTDDQKSKVVRPRYSVLKNSGLKRINLDMMRPWRENLKLYLQEKGFLR